MLLVVFSNRASAAISIYTSETSFIAQNGTGTVINFDSSPGGPVSSGTPIDQQYISSGIDINGFAGSTPTAVFASPSIFPEVVSNPNILVTAGSGQVGFGGGGFEAVFTPPVAGTGLWIGGLHPPNFGTTTFEAFDPSGASLGLIDLNATLGSSELGNLFFGITSANGLKSFRIDIGDADFVWFDDIRFGGAVASPGILIVNSNADPGDGVINAAELTLREAINAANASPGPHTIKFAIGGGGPQTIVLQSALPPIKGSLLIDGATQPGFGGVPLVTIDAASTGKGLSLLNAANSTIRAIAIANAEIAGINLEQVTSSVIENVIASWNGPAPKGIGVNLFQSSGNRIENVTAVNREFGIQLFFSDSNTVRENDFSHCIEGAAGHGKANSYLNNKLTFASAYALAINEDKQFAIAGNDFAQSAHGLYLYNIDGLIASPAAGEGQVSIDVSSVPGTALFLDTVRNSEFSGLDLSWGGAANSGKGIFINHGRGNLIKATTAKQRTLGVEVEQSDANELRDLDLTWFGSGQSGIGVSLYQCAHSIVETVNSPNREIGVKLFFANSTLLQNNELSHSGTGISAGGSANTFIGNNVSFASSYAISITADAQFQIIGNDLRHSANGIYLFNIDGLICSPFPGSAQIKTDLRSIPGIALFAENVVNSRLSEFDLSWTGENTAGWDLPAGGTKGLLLHDCTHTVAGEITVANRSIGAEILSQNVTLECSTLINNTVGVKVNHSNPIGVVVTGCTISGNSTAGYLGGSGQVLLAENNFWGSTSGPKPIGSGDLVQGSVDVQPFLTAPALCSFPKQMLDPSFGNCGKVITEVAAIPDLAPPQLLNRVHAVMLGDGRFLVGVPPPIDSSGRRFTLFSYKADGTLDTAFGVAGSMPIDFPGLVGQSMVLDRTGKLVLGGYAAQPGTGQDWVIGRRNQDGTADNSFGNNGWTTVDFGGDDTIFEPHGIQARLVAVDSQNRIVAQGLGAGISLIRINPNGVLDATFGNAGKFNYFFSYAPVAITIDAQDRLLLAGYVENQPGSGADFFIYRLAVNGSFDSSFGIDGKVRVDFDNRQDIAEFINVDSASRIVVGGSTRDSSTSETAIARLNDDGSLDSSFGSAGKVRLAFDFPTAMALDGLNRIVVAGNSYTCIPGDCSTADYELFRFTESGTLDSTLGNNGRVTINFCGSSYELAYEVAVDQQNNIILPGRIQTGPSTVALAIARVLSTSVRGPVCAPPPPAITCPPDVTLSANAQNQAAVPDFRPRAGVTGLSPCNPGFVIQDPAPGTFVGCGTYTITLTVNDASGHSSSCSARLNIISTAPAIQSVSGPATPLELGTAAAVTVQFLAADGNASRTCLFTWGDGSSTSVNGAAASGTSCSIQHTYIHPGVYRVIVSAYGQCSSVSTAIYEFVVIYDPTGGFVTGGGWINSPAGAYLPNPALIGRANFGFVSKYEKGATVPTGDTEFQFRAGDINFKSKSYEWLVIGGANAKYKGVGTINGQGNYGFMLTATDGQINGADGNDKIRIKIWNKSSQDGIIYDNKLGSSDDSYSAQELGGGSIVLHK